MAGWSARELGRIAGADELELAPSRSDDTPRPGVTMWVVRHGDGLFVRSVNGRGAAWFRNARREGLIRTGGVAKAVRLVETDGAGDELDAAYRAKYHRYAASVDRITSAEARAATLALVPLWHRRAELEPTQYRWPPW